jgi:hypothetical protein
MGISDGAHSVVPEARTASAGGAHSVSCRRHAQRRAGWRSEVRIPPRSALIAGVAVVTANWSFQLAA